MKIAWVCDSCDWLQVSDSKLHHCMDNCPCGKCGMDLEEYGNRFVGQPRTIAIKLDGSKWKYKRPRRKDVRSRK